MRKTTMVLAGLAVVAMASTGYAVSFDYVTNFDSEAGLASHTVRVTATGINVLGCFTITGGAANQTGDEWDHTGSPNPATDTCVVFGDLRLPDVEGPSGNEWDPAQGPRPTPTTVETATTLTNYAAGPPARWDDYLELDPPSTTDVTSNLLRIVVPYSSDDITVFVRVWTAAGTCYDSGALWLFPPPPPPPGDLDRDGDIDLDDLNCFSDGWYGVLPPSYSTGDFDFDGDVDLRDLNAFSDGWYGPHGPGGGEGAVPEPSTIVMLVLGAACLVGWRKRRSAKGR